MMVNVDEAHTAKLKTHGQEFEILIDSDKAIAFKSGNLTDIKEVLAVEQIYSDAKKGLEVSPNALKECFGTDDVLECAKQIIMKGEFSLTQEYKQKLKENKKRQIISLIHVNAVDPTNHLPHPPQRIEAAMDEAKVHIDEFGDTQKQMQEVLKQIRPILPIKFEIKEIAVKIPAEFATKSYNILKNFGKKTKEDWLNDGSLAVVIEMPGGLEEDFYEKLNALCHGTVESKVLSIK
jgi:ribosome maturation protein SDO1